MCGDAAICLVPHCLNGTLMILIMEMEDEALAYAIAEQPHENSMICINP